MLAFEMYVSFNDFAVEQKNHYDKVVRGQKNTSPLSFISLFFFQAPVLPCLPKHEK